MKRTLISAAVAAAAILAIPATAQMMGGYGYEGSGMGPGMMGGYGGYGPGYGMGPGMMGGYGQGYGMGPGMMGGYGRGGYGPNLDLTDEQRDKIADIQRDVAQKRWTLMSGMHQQRFELLKSGNTDDAALRKSFQAMQETQKQMFEANLDAGKRMEAVLTPEQRKQVPRGFGRFGMMW